LSVQLRAVVSLLLCALLLSATALSQAQTARTVPGLYEAEQAVPDQSRRALAEAARAALATVLARVSGRADAAFEPTLTQALAGAADMVQRFTYRNDSEGLRVQLLFDRIAINELLLEAGLPVWTSSRPVALVYLAIDEPGGRYLVDASADPAVFAALHAAFTERGVPLQLPLGDLQDLQAFDVDDAWRLDAARASAAAGRYRIDEVLVVRVFRTGEGAYMGDAQFLFRDGRLAASVNASALDDLASSAAALVADSMVARYALTAQSAADDAVTVRVDGIKAYSDYGAVMRLLETVELTERVVLRELSGEEALLWIYTRAEPSQLAALLRLDGRLLAQPVAADSAALRFRWRP